MKSCPIEKSAYPMKQWSQMFIFCSILEVEEGAL